MINVSPLLYFTLDGVLSHTPGWRTMNTLELAKPAPMRGGSPLVVPGATGGRPMRQRPTYAERTLSIHVFGRKDGDGNLNASEIEGLQVNLAYLANAWAPAPPTPGSVRTLVLHRLGTTMTGPVQVIDMDWDDAEMPVAATLVMRLILPEGQLT